MADRILVSGLRVRGFHGVHEFERKQGQDFVIDVALEGSQARAAAADALDETVDYAALVARLAEEVSGPPVNLIETLAARLADICLQEPRVSAVEVTVHKPEAPVGHPVADIAVSIRRERA